MILPSSPIFEGAQQLVWNSTSLNALKKCPRYYQYSILQGWATGGENIHIAFGLAYHKAIEVYLFAKAEGADHDMATIAAVKQAMTMTWPDILLDNYKSRWNLVRSVVWYLENFKIDPIETLILANGQPAVEITFAHEIDYTAPNGQPYMLAGHLDRIGTFMGELHFTDLKTTKQQLGEFYFATFNPNNQMSLYSFSGKFITNTPLKKGIIDAAQILVNGTRFQRGFVNRDSDQLAEWHDDLHFWLSTAELHAKRDSWPMNDMSCYTCDFKRICAMNPKVRDSFLASNFTKRIVNPLEVRQ